MTAGFPGDHAAAARSRSWGDAAARARWPVAALRAARPRQWPKNLLVFAAPLAAKRYRPVAAGQLPKAPAVALAAGCVLAAAAGCAVLRLPLLGAVVGCYLAASLLYTFGGKHVPVLELLLLASGFVLRALGGAVATGMPPSLWFLLVVSLGALLVVTAKRSTEMALLGFDAARHRPVTRHYRRRYLRAAQRGLAALVVVGYLLWALTGTDAWMWGWHLGSTLPLAAALIRFDRLTASATGKGVEDLLIRDLPMLCVELVSLSTFMIGL